MRKIILGDCHGHFDNLRSMLLEMELINEKNERINLETGLYSVGDLLDGGSYNDSQSYEGDHKCLEHAHWFDGIVLGNHEYAFIGGPQFSGLRRSDRKLMKGILDLEREGLYVPALLIEDYLVTHAGLAKRWSFHTAQDAYEAVLYAWDKARTETSIFPILDWIGPLRSGGYGNDTGGVFWLDWLEDRNINFNQIVGHSAHPEGPIKVKYLNGSTHWNIDTGGGTGLCLSGVIIEDGNVEPFHWGTRFSYSRIEDEIEDE